MLSVGSVVRFNYEQGQPGMNRIAKVVAVRDLKVDPLHPASIRRRPLLRRNRFLITAKQDDGQVRSFYTDEMGTSVKKVGLLSRVVMYCMGCRF